MNDYPPIARGGRGQTAPYNTCHYRIPEPIKPTVQKMAAAYRQCIEEAREPEAMLRRVEQAIDPNTPALASSTLEDKHEIAQLQKKIAELEEAAEISAKLLNHARREKQEALEEAAETISQKQAAIERLHKELWDAEQAIASQTQEKIDSGLEQENLELHKKVGDLDLELQKALEEIDSFKRHLKGLEKDWDETQLAQSKAATLLNQALELKANAGGAIKAKIRQALPLLDDI